MRSEAFLERAADDRLGVVYDLEPDSRRLIVTFAAFRGKLPVRHYAFFAMLAEIDVKAAFLRDHAEAWYHRGVTSIGGDVDSVAEFLRGLTGKADETVMLGTSSGAYAALLFGSLLSCESHAFSPQTFIDPGLRIENRDRRFQEQFDALGADMDARYADLRAVVSRTTAPLHLYYGVANRLDRIHAEHLGDFEHVTLHGFDVDTHLVARHLRDVGELVPFLERLAGRPTPSE